MSILFLTMLCAYGFGVISALAGGQGWLGRSLVAGGALVGASAGLALGIDVITTAHPFVWTVPELLPLANGLDLRLDSLSAFFLILIGIGAIPASLYGVGYSATYEDGRASLRQLGVMLNLFLLSMSLVVFANNVLTFLIMWEAMSLTSYFLVMTEAHEPGTRQAGLWYVGMTHVGVALLLAAFILLMGNGSGTFADLRTGALALDPVRRDVIFLLALFGFGSKAGIVPLHVWLPRAHPAAPSHVSALMSGVMIKLGVYGLLRVGLDLLGGGPTWWGALVLAVGVLSAILGILYALMENDLKRLLAYSSVENIGIIFIGVGAGLLFHARGLETAATLAFIAALYHSLNHTAFKGLLFMGAGAVLHATHTRDMNHLGGLIKRMPWTAGFFLVGAVAIAGLPPLNGFASEWLLFQALLPGVNILQPLVAALMTVAVGLLALTSGLAAAGFVKAFGITFLAMPRSPEAEHAHESPRTMLVGMGLLALACIGLGLAPTIIVPVLGRVLAGLGGLPTPPPTFTVGLYLPTPLGESSMSPPLLALALLVVLGLIPLVLWAMRTNRTLRLSDTWGCGRIGQTSRMEYTATAFAEPLRRVFAELYRPTKELTIDAHPDSKYFVQSIAFKSEIRSWFDDVLYAPLLAGVRWSSGQIRRFQSGSLHGYLAYLFLTLVAMLAALLILDR